MATERTASFGIRVPVETNAGEGADAVDALRKSITESQNAVKAYGSSLRNLRGSSEEVVAAKAKLKAAINAERDAMSRGTLELGKQGKTLFDSAKKTEAAGKGFDAIKKGAEKASGPAADLSKKFEDLKGKFTGAGAGANIAVLGFGLLAAAVVAVGAAVAGAAVSLASFILSAGNELRTMALFREAATGSAENAKAFGHQIEVLATKVPMSTSALNDLSLSLTKSVINTRVSGKALVDTFNAVAQVSSAMGDSAGKAIEDIILRGKQMGRMSLGVNELQGTGIQFTDVAKQLSENLKIGLLDAQMQLRTGRVKIEDGAKAIRDVTEKRFGKVNAALMLDLPKMVQKFKDSLQQLVSGVDLGPLLAGFKRFADLFDKSSVSGAILKDLITDFGAVMNKVFVVALPFVETFFTYLAIEALKLEISFLKLGLMVKKTFGLDFKGSFDETAAAISAAHAVFAPFEMTLNAVGAIVEAGAPAFKRLAAAIRLVGEAYDWVSNAFKTVTWDGIGTAIVDGIMMGLKAGWAKLETSVGDMATGIKDKFKSVLGIHSPSAVFEAEAKQIPAGAAKGIESSDAPNKAVAGMVSARLGGGGGGSGAAPAQVNVTLSFPNAKSGDDVAKHLTSPSFKAEFQRVLEEMLMGIGGPTHTPQGDVT